MSDLTPEALDALAVLEQAATPGRWEADEIDDLWYQEADGQPVLIAGRLEPADAALIAALRDAAPRLIAAARESVDLALDLRNQAEAGRILREQIEALHRPWYEAGTKRYDFTVIAMGAPPAGHVCRIGPEHDRCTIDRDNPEDSEHAVLACFECQVATEDGEVGHPFWPCATARALTTGGDRG